MIVIIEKYSETLEKYISKLHEASEGRYELTGYDICVLEAALIQYQEEKGKQKYKLKDLLSI